ncbi:MAG: 3',5'-cyclic-nucleotide phosphodiesterase [Acidobacteriota bacterium]
MKFQLLPSTFDDNGCSSPRQHLTSFVIDDRVAIDAGSLGFAVNDIQRRQIRDVVLTHAHLDHIAGLPLFIDDLFSELDAPVRIHASEKVIEVLERDVFNWSVYPRFSELSNSNGAVMEYRPLSRNVDSHIAHLKITPLDVNHNVPSTGFVISDSVSTVVMTGDTAEMAGFWDVVNAIDDLKAILVECAFPDELEELANSSFHMTPTRLKRELEKFSNLSCPVYAINLKPRYRERTIAQLEALKIDRLEIFKVGAAYEF